MKWWRANLGRLAGSIVAGLLVTAALTLAVGAMIGAIRAAAWMAGF